MRDDNKCRKAIYCDFILGRDFPDATIEVCCQCGKKVVYYKKEKGRIDNRKYLADHIRNTVQPYGKTKKLFFQIYGHNRHTYLMHELGKKMSKKQIEEMWEQIRRDVTRPGKTYI